MEKIAIELKNYSFKYMNSEKWVLREANFKLNFGEIIVLSGLSGEGKSTLLASVNGIIPNITPGTQEGEIFVNGESIKGKRPSEISKVVGSVLQNADSQIINSNVEDEIAFGCENINMTPKEIDKQINMVCEFMELDKEWITKKLSGGQKQRLITACIFAMKQKILIFDEPLANLDLEGSHNLLKMLKGLSEKGYAVLLIEHRLDIILPYADKVAWLNDGSIEIYKDKKQALNSTVRITYNKLLQIKESEVCFEVENLSYSVANKEILKELTFSINKGERVVILGENGCGKTTLMRLLAKMIKPTKGKINQFIDKRSINKPKSSWFKKLGFVYQNPNYQLFMPSVLDEVKFQSKSSEITEEMMEKFNLKELKDRHPQSLSEGQKRRLTIASVLVSTPEVLLLDEPTVGQDYYGLRNVIRNLNELHERTNNTMITITHDFRCAEALADKIIWLKHGRIHKIGNADLAKEYFNNINSIKEKAII